MKRIALSIITLFVCVICRADNFYQHWYVEDNAPIQTSCTTGGDIILPTSPTKYGYDFIGWEQLLIQRIEYLELPGGENAFIDTGITPYSYTTFRIKLNMSETTGGAIICNGHASGDKAYRFFNYDQAFWFDIGDWTKYRLKGGSFKKNITYDLLIGMQYVKDYATDSFIVGTQKNIAGYIPSGTLQILDDAKGKIYLMQIWQNDILVRDFIPVIDGNGTPCLFDKVEGKFYYSAGTGNFIAGPVIG